MLIPRTWYAIIRIGEVFTMVCAASLMGFGVAWLTFGAEWAEIPTAFATVAVMATCGANLVLRLIFPLYQRRRWIAQARTKRP